MIALLTGCGALRGDVGAATKRMTGSAGTVAAVLLKGIGVLTVCVVHGFGVALSWKGPSFGVAAAKGSLGGLIGRTGLVRGRLEGFRERNAGPMSKLLVPLLLFSEVAGSMDCCVCISPSAHIASPLSCAGKDQWAAGG